MAGVAIATPTLPVPHQNFALLSVLATPTVTCWLIILCFGHSNFGNHPPPMYIHTYIHTYLHALVQGALGFKSRNMLKVNIAILNSTYLTNSVM